MNSPKVQQAALEILQELAAMSKEEFEKEMQKSERSITDEIAQEDATALVVGTPEFLRQT